VEYNSSYNNLFPLLQARYELTPKSILRASFSTTLSRARLQPDQHLHHDRRG
jgi:hypothetical protein